MTRPHFTVALVGNPNTGKSTLFGGLVGVHQHVGNYPGATVEKKSGRMTIAGRRFEVIDLPGLYSLAPRSRDEMVVVDLLLGRQSGVAPVDAVVCIVDACNLERHFYLFSQVLELGRPTVLAVNMLDLAERREIQVDCALLERRLGIPVVPIQANRRLGLAAIRSVLADFAAGRHPKKPRPTSDAAIPRGSPARHRNRFGRRFFGGCQHCGDGTCGANAPFVPDEGAEAAEDHASSGRGDGTCRLAADFLPGASSPFPEVFEVEVSRLVQELAEDAKRRSTAAMPRCLARRLILDVDGYLQQLLFDDARWRPRLEAVRERLATAGCPVPTIETSSRYDWARRILDGATVCPERRPITLSDRIDRALTHRASGLFVFALVMLFMFQAVFVWARPATEAIQWLAEFAGQWVKLNMADGALRSLLSDGLIGGVGAVLAFLPQILVLFAFLAILEDCGYMARTAYLMDRLMARVGLNGKSFIPLLSSFACAVPGIMAARVIEDDRDRLTTILVAPLLTCSARLPVYTMLIAAFIPEQKYWGGLLTAQGLTLASLYLLGTIAAVAFALLFKRTIFRGPSPPFVMELPSYKWPSPRTVLMRMAERGWVFLRCAGTLILAVSILVWAALYYPHDPDATHQRQQQNSFLGQAGRLVEPIVRPLGWDWRIGCAVLASFPAREVVVATLGVMYHVDDESNGDAEPDVRQWSKSLRSAKWDGTDRPVFSMPVALSIMVFFALCAQCAATLAVIRRETNSWRWPAFTFAYTTALAYAAAFATYRVGTWIAGG